MPNMPDYNSAQGSGPAASGVVATSVDPTGRETNVNLTMTGGGEIGLKSMDANDKSKMSHALDNATGKSTHWVNGVSGINFTVTPTRKVVVENNPFCRQYLVVIAKGSYQKQFNGTACVTTDGSWHTI
jgi:surface antigen